MEDDFASICGASPATVQRLGVRPVAPRVAAPDPAPLDMSAIAASIQQMTSDSQKQLIPVIHQASRQAAAEAVQAALQSSHSTMVGTFQVIARILAARFILLLAVIGGFSLAVMVMNAPTPISAAILAGYVISTVWPLVWLYVKAPGSAGTTSASA